MTREARRKCESEEAKIPSLLVFRSLDFFCASTRFKLVQCTVYSSLARLLCHGKFFLSNQMKIMSQAFILIIYWPVWQLELPFVTFFCCSGFLVPIAEKTLKIKLKFKKSAWKWKRPNGLFNMCAWLDNCRPTHKTYQSVCLEFRNLFNCCLFWQFSFFLFCREGFLLRQKKPVFERKCSQVIRCYYRLRRQPLLVRCRTGWKL